MRPREVPLMLVSEPNRLLAGVIDRDACRRGRVDDDELSDRCPRALRGRRKRQRASQSDSRTLQMTQSRQ